MEWSDKGIMNLIENYRKHPNLWDSRDSNYRKRDKKKNSIREMSVALKVSPEEVERKIGVILAQYRRARARAINMKKSGMGADEIDKAVWFGFKCLSFLHDKNKPHETRETSKIQESETEGDVNISTNSQDDNVTTEESNTAEIQKDTELEDDERTAGSKLRKKFFSSPKKPLKLKNTNVCSQVIDVYNILKEISEKRKGSNLKDEFSVYGEHIAMKLRKFDPITRAEVEHKFNNIIHEAEMKMLNSQFNNYYPSSITCTYDSVASTSSICSSSSLEDIPSHSESLTNR